MVRDCVFFDLRVFDHVKSTVDKEKAHNLLLIGKP